MDQSSGSSVQTKIFPPENIKNIKSHTKYTERNIVKMMLNCFVLNTGVLFPIPLGSKVSVGGYKYPIESLSIGIFKKYIWEQEEENLKDLTNNVSKLDLWQVNVKEVDNVSNEDDIVRKLEGDKMKPNFLLSDYFSVSDPPPMRNIHIIIYRPTTNGLIDIPHYAAELGYLPRQDGRGGTLLTKDKQDAYTAEGISLTDPDTNQRSDLVSSLAKRLDQKGVILFRAPPYTGKSSLAQLLENYLVVNNSSETLRVIRVSLLWGSSKGKKCEYDTFCDVWEKIVGIEWYKWVEQCEKIQTVLIMDETQRIYESKDKDDVNMGNTGTADEFWNTIKDCLQGRNLKVIMFAAYAYGANSAGLSTPLHIPLGNSMSLTDIKFTDKEIEEYVNVYCHRNFGLPRNDYIISQFILYIKYATAGHVGFVRHILQHTKDEMQSKIRNVELTWEEIHKYLNSPGFDQTINSCRAAPKLDKFTETQKKICEHVYLNKSTVFLDNDDHKILVKTGIFVVNNLGNLCFSAPLIERSFFQQYYGREVRSDSTPKSLYDFIVKTFTIICNESDEILKYSLGTGEDKRLLEQTWQKEFYRLGTRALGGSYFLSCDVGPRFKSEGYIDFYVGGLGWAIELLREGLGMKEHNTRFDTTVGEYKEIVKVANETAIIDIRSKSKKVQKLKERFVHVSYSDNYDAFIIECLDKKKIEIKFKKLV